MNRPPHEFDLTRREFLGVAGGVMAVAALSQLSALAQPVPPTPVPRQKLQPFGYGDVKLTGGPLKAQYDHALDFFLNLNEDRILKVYRQSAGLPAPGADMGGWYNAEGFGPGHALGQWLSALSRFAVAGNAEAAAKVGRLVEGFAATLGHGEPFYTHRFPAYIYDKHVIGLTDAFRYAGIESARDALKRATDIALPFLPEKALTREEMRQRPHKDPSYTYDESYTLPENLFIAHQIFGDARYLEMAKRYLHDEPYFDKLARGEPAMVGQHAYSHVNALSSAAMAYQVLGTEKHLAALRNAWDMIVRNQQFASGGWGPKEEFVQPGKGKLFESLTTTRNHFETPCGSYATFKLARYLTQFTSESRYGDGLERMLYNGILAAKRIQPDGSTFYYSDYQDGARKVFHPDKWPCCSGTYPQVIADYLVSAYFHDEDSVHVNLFVPSELRWKRNGGHVTLIQQTDYPESEKVVIRIESKSAADFTVKLRIPDWATGAKIIVNRESPVSPAVGAFAELRRRWNSGDTIEITLPLAFRHEPIDAQHPETVAVMGGPVMHVGLAGQPVFSPSARGAAPIARSDWRFVPFYKINDETYTTYFTSS